MQSIKFIVTNFRWFKKCPKHFWKILGQHKRKQQPNIEINTLYECFKDLNTKGSDEQQSTTLQNELPNDSNVHINGYISQNEIFKCIKNLKNNKACGEDEIINEYIKSTSGILSYLNL
jgi:hypothetical protein